jgi:hypothetical protein
MKTRFFFILLFIPFQGVYCHQNEAGAPDQPYNIDAEPFHAVDHHEKNYGCGGNLRTGYIESSIGTDHTVSANAVGGELGCGYDFNKHIKARFGIFTALDTGLNHGDDNNIQDDFFNHKKDGYVLLGEAVLFLSYDKFEAHLGRQRLDSPHMDADDLRMIPNLFEAYLLDYHATEELYFGTGFVRQMSGWENGADQSRFIGIGDAFGGSGDASWVSWFKYEQEKINSNLWYYLVPDHLQIFYAELTYSDHINSKLFYTLGLQYDWGKDIGAAKTGPVQAHTWGVLASLSGYDVTASFAYNRNHSKNDAIPSLGGGPFFTSMEELTLDAISGGNASSIFLGLEYSPFSFATIGGAFGKFHAGDKSQFEIDEFNVYLTIDWEKYIALELMYANLDDKNSGENDHQFRAIFTYFY